MAGRPNEDPTNHTNEGKNTMNKPSKAVINQKPITISVAYCWSNSDEWGHMRTFLNNVVREAQQRWVGRLKRSGELEFEDTEDLGGSNPVPAEMPFRCGVRRLRAGAGRFAWTDICNRIKNSDLLLFDITPATDEEKTRDNVMLELGYAKCLSEYTHCPVIVTATDGARYAEWVPSDLQGMILAGYAEPTRSQRSRSSVVSNPALRMAVVSELIRIFDRVYIESLRRDSYQSGPNASVS